MRVYLATSDAIPNHFSPPCEHRFLVSYASTAVTPEKLVRPVEASGTRDYCVDSGAHMWLSAYFKKGAKPPVAAAERHIAAFMDTLRRLPRAPLFVVELDLQAIYGFDTIAAWRRDIWVPFERELGVRVCYVWHIDDGAHRWDELLDGDDYRYLGLATRDLMPTEERARMVYRAYQAGKPVHGFASTGSKILKHVPYYSVDSTSWLAGQVFGSSRVFDTRTGQMRVTNIGRTGVLKNAHETAATLATAGIPTTLGQIMSDDATERRAFARLYALRAAASFREFERWYTAYWKARGVDWDGKLTFDR